MPRARREFISVYDGYVYVRMDACSRRENPERSRTMRNDEITLRRVGRVGQFDEYTL